MRFTSGSEPRRLNSEPTTTWPRASRFLSSFPPIAQVMTDVVIPGLAGDLSSMWADLGVVAVESDVRAAAVAESGFGYGRTFDPFAFVSVGTGVSYCVVWDGHPWAGVHGAAILLGSGIVVEREARMDRR